MAEGRSSRSLPQSIPQSSSEQIPSSSSVLLLGSKDFPPLNPQISSNGAASNLQVSQSGNPIPGRSYIGSLNNNNSNIQASSAATKLSLDVTKIVDGKSTAIFSSGELKTHISICESYVVGYFVGKRHQFPFVKENLIAQWNPKGDFSMTIHGENVFLFKFVQEEDRTKVLDMGSVNIGKRPFLIRPWSIALEKNLDSISTVPVWMNLRQVPLHLWNQLGLSRIASIVGTPIMTDTPTALKTRMSYARVCVEVAADCSFPAELPIQIDDVKFVVKAEYQWKPTPCSHCKSFGHSSAKCSLNPTPKVSTKWVPKAKAVISNSDIGPSLDNHEASICKESERQVVADPIREKEGVVTPPSSEGAAGNDLGVMVSSVIADKSIFVEEGKDDEGFERVSRKKKGSDKKRKKIVQVHQLPISHISPYSALRDLEGDDDLSCFEDYATTEVGENSTHVTTHSEVLMGSDNDMDLVVRTPRVPMTATQNVEKLFKVFSNFEASGSFEVKNSIFNELADKHQKIKKSKEKSAQEKELEKLDALPPDKEDTKLGRGHRSVIKKKI